MAGSRAFDRHDILIEAPLPPPGLPAWVKLSPRIWGFLARVWWWYLNHHDGQETRTQAEERADRAAALLIGLAASGEDVVVLAHGFFNHLIGRSLKRQGWRLADSEGYIASVKAGANLIGFHVGQPRKPFRPLSAQKTEELRGLLSVAGAIPEPARA